MNTLCLLVAAATMGLERPDVEFKVFQFPPGLNWLSTKKHL